MNGAHQSHPWPSCYFFEITSCLAESKQRIRANSTRALCPVLGLLHDVGKSCSGAWRLKKYHIEPLRAFLGSMKSSLNMQQKKRAKAIHDACNSLRPSSFHKVRIPGCQQRLPPPKHLKLCPWSRGYCFHQVGGSKTD